uniref:ATP-dependent Clp protease proteolytic subunit n=1 Tax=Corydalis davidii TaxID=2306220 RepID=A0A7U0QHB5_9MAGN|nr:ATP-dependent Clp protease proteolytic subunit [Corydalis davidii]QQW51924.1 ATP-dependent Clp protease proteolytic subunit [Corydalis davidii]
MPVGLPKVPFLILEAEDEEASWVDIYNRLHRQRSLFLFQSLDYQITATLLGLMVFLTREDKTRDHWVFINSRGGLVLCGLALFDMIRKAPPYTYTMSLGAAHSMGSLVLSAGEFGERIASPLVRVMLHQPNCGFLEPDREVHLDGDEVKSLRDLVTKCYAQRTGKSWTTVFADMQMDYLMSARQAKIHGLVDVVGGVYDPTKKISPKF